MPIKRRHRRTHPTRLLGKAGGAAATRRTLASTIYRIVDPTQVARPRPLRDASTGKGVKATASSDRGGSPLCDRGIHELGLITPRSETDEDGLVI